MSNSQITVKISVHPEVQVDQKRMKQSNNKEVLTYKRNAGSQQQDSDEQVFKLLHNQFPDALTCKKKAKE